MFFIKARGGNSCISQRSPEAENCDADPVSKSKCLKFSKAAQSHLQVSSKYFWFVGPPAASRQRSSLSPHRILESHVDCQTVDQRNFGTQVNHPTYAIVQLWPWYYEKSEHVHPHLILASRLEAILVGRRPSLLDWRPSLLGWRTLQLGWRPLLLAWRPLLLGWRPLLLGWRPLLLGWRPLLLVGGHCY